MPVEKAWYKSKKFWATVSGVLAVVGSNYLGLSEAQIFAVVGVISSFVIGQGAADLGKNKPLPPAE